MSEEKLEDYLRIACEPTALTENTDGLLHDGDVIRLKSSFAKHFIFLSALPLDISHRGHFLLPTRTTGTEDFRVIARNTFRVFRNDVRIRSSVPLMYDECIYLSTIHPSHQLYLFSEMRTYNKFAALSGNQEVSWQPCMSPRSLWRAKCLQSLKKRKDTYIPVNFPIILTHVVTNQNLNLEDCKISTIMGTEYEISAKNCDSKTLHHEKNIWIFEAPYANLKLQNFSHI